MGAIRYCILLTGDKKEKVKKAKQVENEEPADDKKVFFRLKSESLINLVRNFNRDRFYFY